VVLFMVDNEILLARGLLYPNALEDVVVVGHLDVFEDGANA